MFANRKIRRRFCLVLVLMLMVCESACYYQQAVVGQLSLLTDRQPIKRVIGNVETPDALKHKLKLVLEARQFAEEKLHLPVGENYLAYTDLKRPYVVWAVYAAPEFSLKPVTWYYPVIGRSAYRGYFSENAANRYARRLEDKALDVYVAGVAAYSTLGWFDDAVLSTFINRSDTGIVALIFHELAHQLLYIPSDSMFNESFATTVEWEGLRRWLVDQGNRAAFLQYERGQQRRQQFIELVIRHRNRLEQLYASQLPIEKKRVAKATIFDEMYGDYLTLKSKWGGYAGYDGWFERSLNNAKLISVATYNDFVPAFMKILKSTDGDLISFYDRCRELAQLPEENRHRDLRQMLEPIPMAGVHDRVVSYSQ